MKKSLLVILVSLLLSGCNSEAKDSPIIGFKTSNIHYFQDQRTNLCFAGMNGYKGFTEVPCTNEVIEIINK